jgi:hypothetical protein
MPVMISRPIPFQFANMEVARQIADMGARRQAELNVFLPVLQANPYDPDIIKRKDFLPTDWTC